MAKRKRGNNRTLDGNHDSLQVDPKAAKLKFNSYEDIADSEDEFHINADKVLLDGTNGSKRMTSDQDGDMQLSDEEVLGYASEDSLEDEDQYDQADEDTQELHKSDGESEEGIGGWGASREDYYNADEIQTEQDALDEEAEARRIQQKRLKALRDADFGFDENEWLGSGKQQPLDQTTAGDTDGVVITEVLPQLQITQDMGPAERLKLLKARYPEFEPLSKELLQLQPLHTEMRQQQIKEPNNAGLKLKLNALSGYLGALAMYFAILTSPASMKDPQSLPLAPNELREHEIMDTLVRCRDLWETTKDLQTPLTPEGSQDNDSDLSESFATALEDHQKVASPSKTQKSETQIVVPKRAKPETAASLARREARLARTEKSLAALTSSINARNRDPARRSNRPEESLRSRQDPNDDSDLGDEPEAEQGARRKKSLKFYTSQIAQKSAKRENAGRTAGGDDDVPHRERLRDRQERLNREAEKRGRNAQNDPTNLDEPDDDSNNEETNAQREANIGNAQADNSMDDAERDLMQQMLAKKESKRARREAKLTKDTGRSGRDTKEQGLLTNGEQAGDARRQIGYKISANKGLTPTRRKEVKNPRVKKRLRFEDKKKKLRSIKPAYRGGEGRGGYAGELTGIKKGLVRSVKL